METNKPPKKDMRGRLETWRVEKGRTPMKRLSYMHDYATPEGTVIRVHPVVHSPRLLQYLKRFDSVKKTLAAPLSARRQTPYVSSQNKVKIGRDGFLYRENRENIHPSIKPTSKAKVHTLSTAKPSRREQLEKWLANHGTVNRPCNGKSSHMTVRTASTDIRRPAPLETTVFSRETKKLGAKQPLQSQPGQARDAAYMRALKEQFQRDIDDTVAQILSEGDYQICDSGPTVEAGCDDGGTTARDISDDLELARQLDFDSESLPFNDQQGETDSSQLHGNGAGEIQISTESNRGYSGDNTSKELSGSSRTSCPTPTAGHKLRRRSHIHFDPSLMFKSTTIRYSMALSEPRRKRRHTCIAGTPDAREAKRLLHLTPVRRSTRKNRSGPGLAEDQSLCFDSPSQANGSVVEEYGGVEIIPNKALAGSQ